MERKNKYPTSGPKALLYLIAQGQEVADVVKRIEAGKKNVATRLKGLARLVMDGHKVKARENPFWFTCDGGAYQFLWLDAPDTAPVVVKETPIDGAAVIFESREESQRIAKRASEVVQALLDQRQGKTNNWEVQKSLQGFFMLLREGHVVQLIRTPEGFDCDGVLFRWEWLKDSDPNERWKTVKKTLEFCEEHGLTGPMKFDGTEFVNTPAEWSVGQEVRIVNNQIMKHYNPFGLVGVITLKGSDGKYRVKVDHVGLFKVTGDDIEEK